MQIKDIMSRDVKTISPESTVKEAAQLMQSLDIGSLPVADSERIQGMLTDRDIVVRAVAKGMDPGNTKTSSVMSKGIIYIFEDQEVLDAARLMEVKGIRRLVVLNRDKRLVGFVSLGDVSVMGGDQRLSGEIMGRIAEQPAQDTIH